MSSKDKPTCIHSHTDHIKGLQSGDQNRRKSLKDENFILPPGTEFEAFLNIGAEAEKRSDVIINEMKCSIEKYSEEIERLQKENCAKGDQLKHLQMKMVDKNNIIDSLTQEIYELSQGGVQGEDLSCQVEQLQQEKEFLLQENEELNCKIAQFISKFRLFRDAHKKSPSGELNEKDNEICYLNTKLLESSKKIKKDNEQIQVLKDKISTLNCEICTLRSKLEAQCEQFEDKSSSYQKMICDLQSQVAVLENTLFNDQDQSNREHECYYPLENDQYPTESNISKRVTERDRILQNIILKTDQRDRSIEQYSNLRTKGISAKECDEMTKLIEQQSYEIQQLSNELQSKSLNDGDTTELLKDVSQLQQDFHNPSSDVQETLTYSLLRRIKRIKCRIKSRLQREQARKKEINKQINIYRCEFINLQNEIEELRKKNCSNPLIKDEIKLRVEKEEMLSRYISLANKRLKDLQCKCHSLSKGLCNIEKVHELVINVNEKCI